MAWSRLLDPLRGPGTELLARFRLRRCAHLGSAPVTRGRIWVRGGGRIVLGDRVHLDGRACAIELHARPGAEIYIGDDVSIEPGVSIEATGVIRIGPRCHLGRFCKLMDNQFHAIRGNRAVRPEAGKLQVGADVELGPHVVLLPGAIVEDGCSIEPGRVVSRRVAARPIPKESERHG